jgi:two-component system chemotaxis response regulator CheB
MIKVLVIDDSAVVRRVLSEKLSSAADIEVIGTAIDPFVARDKILRLRPDVVTLDLDMPRMDGLTFLSKLMKYFPLPVVVVSALTPAGSETALRALELGAVDVVAKPGSAQSVEEIADVLADRVRAAMAAGKRIRAGRQLDPIEPCSPSAYAGGDRKILAIGASTGGPEAITRIMESLPANTPGTVIVQHMPTQFTTAFAKRLNQSCAMEVHEAMDNDPVLPGVALIAPGGRHMTLRHRGDLLSVQVKDGPPVHHQRPSVDVLFYSVAQQVGANAVGVILTGMGMDGARGLLAMRQAGAATLAQDESSCVVFGMPKEAVQLGAAQQVVALSKMPREILSVLSVERASRTSVAPSGANA